MAEELGDLDRRITDALSALRCARAIVARSANSTTRWHEDMAERRLNGLLERRLRSGAGALTGATALSWPDG
jgi:hypothetical protein